MLLTVICILAGVALILSIISLTGKMDARVPAFLLALIEVLRCLPLGK